MVALVELLSHPNPYIRLGAVETLHHQMTAVNDDAMHALKIRIEEDEDPNVRMTAAFVVDRLSVIPKAEALEWAE